MALEMALVSSGSGIVQAETAGESLGSVSCEKRHLRITTRNKPCYWWMRFPAARRNSGHGGNGRTHCESIGSQLEWFPYAVGGTVATIDLDSCPCRLAPASASTKFSR